VYLFYSSMEIWISLL